MSADAGLHRHIRREALVSAAINGAISLGFFLAVFGFGAPIAIWGIGGFVFDFLPQSLAVALFGSLVPSLLTRKAALAGRLGPAGAMPGSAAIIAACILRGLIAAILGPAAVALLFLLLGSETAAAVPALAFKVVYGAMLGAFITRLSLRTLLS